MGTAEGGDKTGTAAGRGAASEGAFSVAGIKGQVEAFLKEKDPVKANLAFARLLAGLTEENAGAAYEALKASGERGRDFGRHMNLFFQAWGGIDGQSAVEAAMVDSEGEGREGGRGGRGGFGGPGGPGGNNVMAALSGWAATGDSQAARDWVEGVEDDRQRTMFTFGIMEGMTRSDPDAATSYVLELAEQRAAAGEQEGDGRGRGFDPTSRYMEMIASEQANRGLAHASAWAEGLPEGELKDAAFSRIAASLAGEDLDAVTKWVTEHASQAYAQDAVSEVARRMANTEPAKALEWAESLTGEAQSQAFSSAFNQWTDRDALAASEYLTTMNASPLRDSAVSSFATQLDREDPEAAAAWASTISDANTRVETLESVARTWMRSDSEAAQQWLPSSGLPAEVQQEVLSGGGRPNFGDFGGGGGGPGRDYGGGGRGGRRGG